VLDISPDPGEAGYHIYVIPVDAFKHHGHIDIAVFPRRALCVRAKKNDFIDIEVTPNALGIFSH
jgi:hypothetical protein